MLRRLWAPRLAAPALVGLPAVWALRHLTARCARGWRRGAGDRRRLGPLSARVAGTGSGRGTVVLLHGMVGTGDYFGATFDSAVPDASLVVPDLPGFGRSAAVGNERWVLEDYLSALDAMALAADVADRPLTVAGHSMGGTLALHWAARRLPQTVRVVTWSAPLYRSREEALRCIGTVGPLEALVARGGVAPRLLCTYGCARRPVSGWVAAALRPQVPVTVARAGVEHTWHGYQAAMRSLVLDPTWPQALAALSTAGVPVTLATGRRDRYPAPERAAELAGIHCSVEAVWHPSAAHDLPLSVPSWCADQLRER